MSSTRNLSTTRLFRTPSARPAALLIGLAAGMGSVLGAPIAATAAPAPVPVDRPLISAGQFDFGINLVAGVPSQGGYLRWTNAGVLVRPQLTGFLFVGGGNCGRVQVQYFTAAHAQLGAAVSPTVCAPAATWVAINSFAHADVRHVHINVQRLNPNNTYTTVGTSIENR